MKKIINRKSYDTERAKKVGYVEDNFQMVIRVLYEKNNGEKFIHYINHNLHPQYITETVIDEDYNLICREDVGDGWEMILPINDNTMPIWEKWIDKSDARKEYLEECMANFPKSGGYAFWALEYQEYV